MWLHDPYTIDAYLLRHAETIALGTAAAPSPGDRSTLGERVTIALRVLVDAALAARVRDAMAGARADVAGRGARARSA